MCPPVIDEYGMFPFGSVNISLYISGLAEPYSAKHMVTD